MDRETAARHLAEADAQIGQALDRIADAEARIAGGSLTGQEMSDAAWFLGEMKIALQEYRRHRAAIAQTLAHMNAGPLPD